ncbi:MAG: hypothetical protein JSW73_03000 [Candidatus Woesearchaeota archaeon]|nr:MAG: hypothetical protein JSW73_03000 [Candidatus Woesearchaeota archaeon]
MIRIDCGDLLKYCSLEELKKKIETTPFHIATQLNRINLTTCLKFKEGRLKLKEFYSMPFEKQRECLFETLIKEFHVSEKYASPMLNIKREAFVPKDKQILTYWNDITWIEGLFGMTPPWFSCIAASFLELNPKKEVLVIGFGNGALSAYFSELSKKVFAIEVNKKYLEKGRAIINELGYRNIETKLGDGTYGWEGKKFDAIWPTLATKTIPKEWISQLKEGGILGLFLPLSEEEFAYAYQNFTWWKYDNYEKYMEEWWHSLQVKIFKKKDGNLIETKVMYNLMNLPIYNKEFGSVEESPWIETFGGKEKEILNFLRK